MARQLTTKAQVNGYRFLLRRLEHALVRRDVRMLHDPMRSQIQALLVGSVIGVLVLGGCGVWGLVKPQGSVGDAKIVVSKDGGGNYVLMDGTLHPVLNLASARLITGSNETPKTVSDGKLSKYPRGPLLGIPGAPAALTGSAHPGVSNWTVCDTATVSPDMSGETIALTLIGDTPALGGGIDKAAPDDALLVRSAGTTFLIYDDDPAAASPVRAEVDTRSIPVMRALGLENTTPRDISPGLLNSIPEVDPLTVPDIAGAGKPASSVPGSTIGSVVRTAGINDQMSYYVVLANGTQQISEPTAEILRLADRAGAAPVKTVAPGQVTANPGADALPVTRFPRRQPKLLEATAAPVACQSWSRASDGSPATTMMLVGRQLPLASDAAPVAVSSADGAGPGVDEVYLRPGSGEYVQATGAEPGSPRAESRYYVSDSGVKFGIPDAATGSMLGLGDTPAPAPWPMLSLLISGPTLSRANALVSHDVIAPDADARGVPPPSGSAPAN